MSETRSSYETGKPHLKDGRVTPVHRFTVELEEGDYQRLCRLQKMMGLPKVGTIRRLIRERE